MKVALGWKAHSGWAVLVVVGEGLVLVDRQRITLVEEGADWEKHPYHAAAHGEADALLKHAVDVVRRTTLQRMREALEHCRAEGHEPMACAVLMPGAMPAWTTTEILAVHIRMHKAEGVLFPQVLCEAAEACGVPVVAISEKSLEEEACGRLGISTARMTQQISALGRGAGAPWGKDQRNAAVAAMVALG
ncbi:hypothetical protein SAMN05216570_1738 [Dyella sp. OK004]|uniref:hypothetical protein n=1 Tax=Dyella sp. OK004 TaxID=1855292 RepID=UPI0008E1B415|nr:hypothetical protein [Dyella sp. OK004]SFS03683.1 hypothetical protein SAMN05216570_1738 [Dyella sp. OK004]